MKINFKEDYYMSTITLDTLAKGFEEHSAVDYIEQIIRAQELENLTEDDFKNFMQLNQMEVAYKYVHKIITKEEVELTINYLNLENIMTSEREKRIIKSLEELLEIM